MSELVIGVVLYWISIILLLTKIFDSKPTYVRILVKTISFLLVILSVHIMRQGYNHV